MKKYNKMNYLNNQIQNILSTFSKGYFTTLGYMALIYYMLRPFLSKAKQKKLKKNRLMSYYIMSNIRSYGQYTLFKFSKTLFEKDFKEWLSKDPSNRSRNLLIAKVDDTKSGRKYGFRIPELQYLYDYVKKSKYKTHQIFVLMISLGNYDYIIDFAYKKKEHSDGYKLAIDMLCNFVKKLSPDLKEDFIANLRVTLDGSYGKLKIVNELANCGYDINYVIKSGGQQMCKLPDGKKMKLKQCEVWMKENLKFKDFNEIHGFKGSYCETCAQLVNRNGDNIRVKLLLCRFKSKRRAKYRYILLLTNCLDWYAFRILKSYKGRWSIEVMFRSCKQSFGLKKYSFHHKHGSKNIEMHFGLTFIRYMIISHYRFRHCRPSKTSIDDIINRFEFDLNTFSVNKLQELFAGKYFTK